MTRQEILKNAKPILFNTDMVRAILDGRKTVTRRIPSKRIEDKWLDYEEWVTAVAPPGSTSLTEKEFYKQYPPYHPGDILYVRETWNIANMWSDGNKVTFIYRGDKSEEDSARTISVSDDAFDKYGEMMYSNRPEWRPSIHMPKEAARIWLKVKGVRVERLQECGKGWCLDIEKEGIVTPQSPILYINDDAFHDALREEFQKLWNSTIKKSDIKSYGWDVNPWVWVIEFEVIQADE